MRLESDLARPESSNLPHSIRDRHGREMPQRESPPPALEAEAQLILLASRVHDWGEAFVGDLMHDLKTEASEREEVLKLREVLREVLGERFNPETLEKVIQITHSRETKLGRLFNAIECIGYLRTASRAWRLSQQTKNGPLANGLGWLSSNVLGNITSKLLEYAYDHPAVHAYLAASRDQISTMFLSMPTRAFHNYASLEERENQVKKFEAAKTAWQASAFATGSFQKIPDMA